MKYYFIVPIAGVGKRMGLDIPKQYYKINDKPIFIKTLEVIEKCDLVNGIYIATSKEDIPLIKSYLKEFKITKVVDIIEGGTERQYSVYNALNLINDNSIIAVQDGVRPNIKEQYIKDIYEKLIKEKDLDGMVVGVPFKDTAKIVDNNLNILDTPVRSTLFLAHTPQIFKSKILKKAYEQAKDENFLGTDDSSLVERIGGRIKIYEGFSDNIKITTIEDLKYFE